VVVGARWAMESRFVAERRSELHLRRARAAVAARAYDEARSEFRSALRLSPGDLAARRELAAMELGLGRTELAFVEYQSLTEMHPEEPAGWIRVAELMRRSGLLEAPEAALDKAIEAAPRNAEAHLARGQIRFRLGRYRGAVDDARAAVDADPANADAWQLLVTATARAEGPSAGVEIARQAPGTVSSRLDLATDSTLAAPPAPPRRLRPDAQIDRGNLGAWTREYWPGRMGEIRKSFEAQLQKRDWTEAQRLVDAASSEFPGSAFGPFLAGLLALHRGDLEQAGPLLSAALEIAPRSPVLVATLGRVWSAKGGAAFAAGQLMTLASRDPKLSLARYMAARAYVEAGDPIRAEAALRRGLELQPDSPVPYQHLTDYEFGIDRVPEGLEVAREGVARFPQATDLQMMLGQIEAALGQRRPAIQTYETLLSRRPDLDLARYRLAVLLAPQSDPALRARFLQTLALLRNDRPSDPQLLDALGWMQHQAGHDAEARVLLETAVEHSPDDPSARFHLGSVLLALGDTTRGRQELQRAVDSPRQFPERLEAMRLVQQEPPRGRAESPRH
jgi:predicted Zn-dependent protease